MDEVWKNIAVYGTVYQVSNQGRVRSNMFSRPKIMKPVIRANYESVGLRENGYQRTFLVHRLVALAFVPNPDGKLEVNHIDGDKRNNHFSNLEWCTRQENVDHARIVLKANIGRPKGLTSQFV